MADPTKHKVMETSEDTSELSCGSGGRGSDYVIPSSFDSSLVHVSRDSSLMETKETGFVKEDKNRMEQPNGQSDFLSSVSVSAPTNDKDKTDHTGESIDLMNVEQTSAGIESTVENNGLHTEAPGNEDKEENLNCSLKSDIPVGSLSFRSGNFSLLSGLSDFQAPSQGKHSPSIGSGSCMASPDSFVILNDSQSEASLTPRSPLSIPHEGPKIHYECSSESRQDLSSTVSSESIVVLDSHGGSDTVTSQSSESPDIPVPDIDQADEENSLPLKYFEKSIEYSKESQSLDQYTTKVDEDDDDDDIDLVCETGFDSLLAEKDSKNLNKAVNGTNAKDLLSQIDCINAEKLETMLESQCNNKAEDFSLISGSCVQGTADMNEAEEKLILQMPDVDSNDLFDLKEDLSPPIKIYQPAGDLRTGKERSREDRLSSFFSLDQVTEEDAITQHNQDVQVLGKEQNNEIPLDTKRNWKEVWSEQSSKLSFKSNNDNSEGSSEVPQIYLEDKSDFVKSGSSREATDFSMFESEAIIPGVTDSLVVHMSEFSEKAASTFSQNGKSARTSNDEFSLLDVENDESKLDLQNIDSDPNVSCTPAKGADSEMLDLKTDVPDKSSMDQNMRNIQKQSILHEKLTSAFRQFAVQRFDLQNESHICSMTEKVVDIVSDLFAPAKMESVCEDEPFVKLPMHSHDDFQQSTGGDLITRLIDLSQIKIRLLLMLDGRRIFEEKHGVILQIDKDHCRIDVSGTAESIAAAEAVLESNKWMEEYIVRSLKFDADIIELLQFAITRDYMDAELVKGLDFKLCWNTVPQNKLVLIYVKTPEQAHNVESAMRSLLCSESVIKPDTINMERWNEALQKICSTFPGKVLVKIHDQEKVLYKITCTRDISDTVEDMVRKAEVELKENEELLEPKESGLQMFENNESDIKDSDQIFEKAKEGDGLPCTRCLLIEEEAFRFLQRRKQTELEEVAQNHNVRISYVDKDGFGFELVGNEQDIQVVHNYICSMREETVWKCHKIQSGDLINFLQADDHRVLREVEKRNRCCIDIEQEGDAPNTEVKESYPDFTLGPVTVSTKCEVVYAVEADVVVEAADKLEMTPYGPNRFSYDPRHHRKIVNVVVPKWNPNFGKQKSDFCEVLMELFTDMEKYDVASATLSVQKFNDWPYGKLVKAVLISLQTLTQKKSNLKLKKITLCDTSEQTCQQVVNILSEALGQPCSGDKGITLPRAQKRAFISIFIEKGEIVKEKVDVIINTTSRTLDLNKGGVSKSILDRAGPEMQKQIRRYHPKGLDPGEVAVTSSFNLDCKRVFHGALEPWPQKHSSEADKQKCIAVLEKFVLNCLHQADLAKYRTLAFPALGTGVLEIPPARVARTMMSIIRKFETNHPHTTVSAVRIVIHPKDVIIHRVFKEALTDYEKTRVQELEEQRETHIPETYPEEPQSLGSSLPLLRTEILVNIESIQLYASLGDPTRQEGYDAIVMMWLDDDGFNSAQQSDKILTSSARDSEQMKDFKLSERRQLVTPAGNLPQRKILHVYVSDANIMEAFVRAMMLAEQEGDISSLVFPLRFNDQFAKDYTTYAQYLYQAIEQYIQMDPQRRSQLMKVKICISGKHMVNPVLSALEKLDKDRKMTEGHHGRKKITPLILKVTAMRDDMKKILGELDNPPPPSVEGFQSNNCDKSQESNVVYGQTSQKAPVHDETQIIYIPDIYPYVYETFLFFCREKIQINSSEVQMEYQRSTNCVKIMGQVSNAKVWAQDIQNQLQNMKRDICVDIHDLPEEVKRRKVPVADIVAELQRSINNVLLYIPEDCSDSFHVIGLCGSDVKTAIHKITSQINLVASQAKHHSSNSMEGDFKQTKAVHPIPIDERVNVHTFIMPNGIQVFVYQESILQLPVDCIVNAANEDLDHGGGVARAISDAAGKSMDEECKNYVRKYGKVKVGTSCYTNAGALNYKYIIHTVGPRWKPKEAFLCKRQLSTAIESCITVASCLGMHAVGIPAISAGIFGGPLEECVQIYSEASIQTCSSLGPITSLKEIHFVDKDPSMVAYISSAFAAAVKNKNTSLPPSIEISVNQQTASITSMRPPSDVESIDVKVKIEYPRKQVYRSDGIEIHEYELKKHFKVLVYSNDIINCKASAIAFGQDLKLNHGGLIANTVKKRGGNDYLKRLKEAKKGKNLRYGDVLTVDAGNTFETICFYLEAITPTFSQTDLSESFCVSEIQRCNYNLLHEACGLGLYSLAMPFLGTGSDVGKTELMAGVLFHQVIRFFNDMGPDCSLKELHIVNKEQGPTLAIRDLFEEYVISLRRKLAEEWRNALGASARNPSISSQTDGSLIKTANAAAMMNDSSSDWRTGPSQWRSPNEGKFDSSEEIEEDMEIDGEESEGEHAHETTVEIHMPPKRIPSAPSEDDCCAICLETLDDNNCRVLEKCSHVFCKECIERQFRLYKPVCPTCGTVYGIITGNQPKGEMTVQHKEDLHLPGYEQYGTYIVTYDFEDGIQGEEHPNPTVEYEGTLRSGYLPDCPKGELVLQLFKLAFQRKLMFTIGHSRTTGMDNVVTWNDIHHKTSVTGGPQRFGYPDPHYLDRVQEELAAKGVTEKDLQENTE